MPFALDRSEAGTVGIRVEASSTECLSRHPDGGGPGPQGCDTGNAPVQRHTVQPVQGDGPRQQCRGRNFFETGQDRPGSRVQLARDSNI